MQAVHPYKDKMEMYKTAEEFTVSEIYHLTPEESRSRRIRI